MWRAGAFVRVMEQANPKQLNLSFDCAGQDVASNPKLTVSVESFRHIEITTDVLLLIPDSPVVRNPD